MVFLPQRTMHYLVLSKQQRTITAKSHHLRSECVRSSMISSTSIFRTEATCWTSSRRDTGAVCLITSSFSVMVMMEFTFTHIQEKCAKGVGSKKIYTRYHSSALNSSPSSTYVRPLNRHFARWPSGMDARTSFFGSAKDVDFPG